MEKFLHLLKSLPRSSMTGPVPKRSQLHPGVPVSIVLKAHQRTNQLTTGTVAQVLTAGDHPHGVKVKLQDGQVGRVKSINGSGTNTSASPSSQPLLGGKPGGNSVPLMSDAELRVFENGVGAAFRRDARILDQSRSGGRKGLQDDVRNEERPAEERRLEDFVTFKPARGQGKKGTRRTQTGAETEQAGSLDGRAFGLDGVGGGAVDADESGRSAAQNVLEKEFEGLDSALIAAVLSDHGNVESARGVLKSLND